jgi:HemY protein
LQVGVQHPAPMLLAARAAQRMKAYERRDAWLERVGSEFPKSRDAMLTLKAECLIEQRQFEAARSVLHSLHAAGPRHIASLQLLLRAEQGCANWTEVVRLARLLQKRDALASEAAAGVVVAARLSQLTAQAGDLQRLQRTWRSMDEQEHRHPRLAAVVARAFAAQADEAAARRVLELALEAEWDAELVLLYGQTVVAEALPRIERAEAWLLRRPQDAELLLTLGRLCLLQQLWGKAQRYLEASDALSSEAGSQDFSAALALAQLFEQQGRADAARQHYRRAALGRQGKS